MGHNIAICGKFCVGKTSVARELESEYGFVRVNMAANLKFVVESAYGTLDKSKYVPTTTRDGEFVLRSVREILQGIGESVKSIDRDLWLRWFLRDTETMTGLDLVLDDLRLPFEADALRERGWLIVKLEAPLDVRLIRHNRLYGRMPTETEMSHPTETLMDSIEPDLIYDGSDDAADIADQIIGELSLG